MPGQPEAQINFHIFSFSTNFVVLIKNLFNIIKFEIKIYYFILNNIIKIVYIIFLLSHAVSCRAGLIGPSWARPNGPCCVWYGGPEVRPGHGPLSFMPGLTRYTHMHTTPAAQNRHHTSQTNNYNTRRTHNNITYFRVHIPKDHRND
jgi:hypothetical protein